MDATYTKVTEASEVTEEILTVAEATEEWFGDDQIDWDDFWDRMDGYILTDGTRLDLGGSNDSPAMRKIKKHIRNLRKAG